MKVSNRLLILIVVLLPFFSLILYVYNSTYTDVGNFGDKRTIISFFKNSKSTNTKLFYIYNWEDNVIDRWPRAYTHERLGIEEKYKSNLGIGEAIKDVIGLYDTHQYSLFRTFYYRLSESKYYPRHHFPYDLKTHYYYYHRHYFPYDLKTHYYHSRYRTLDPKEASLFFIPYDIGMDCSINYTNGALMQTKCPTMKTVLNLLHCDNDDDDDDDDVKTCYFKQNSGHDHFILLSINQPMWHFVGHEYWDLYRECYNCTKLAIDTYPEALYSTLQHNNFLSHNWHSIPFPSSFHNNKNAQELPWKTRADSNNRQYPLSFVGSLKVTSKVNKRLRETLMNECSNRKNECLLSKLNSHDSHSISKIIQSLPYANSVLCLMPGGDFPTRKGVLDAMLYGCIPVVFSMYTAHYQMSWFWKTIEKANDCMIYIDRQHAMNNISTVFDQLLDMSRDVHFIDAKLSCISSIGSSLQYNKPFSSPHENDAVSVILDKLLQQ